MCKRNQKKARRTNKVVGRQIVKGHNSESGKTDDSVKRPRVERRVFKHSIFTYMGTPHKCSVSDFTDEELRKMMRSKFYSDILPMCSGSSDEIISKEISNKGFTEKSFSWKNIAKGIGIAAVLGGVIWIGSKLIP